MSMQKILYIEDDRVSRFLMTEIFDQQSDFDLITAEDAEQALDIVAHQAIDLVITDIRMPVRDGFEFLSTLKSKPNTRALPVIALSGLAMKEDVKRGNDAGFSAYITKPMNLDHMFGVIRKCCA